MVQLSDAAYERLRAMKRGQESFSDVVLRLAGRGDLRKLSWLMTKKELAEARMFLDKVDELDRRDALGRS